MKIILKQMIKVILKWFLKYKTYKCDQFEGLIHLLKDKEIIK